MTSMEGTPMLALRLTRPHVIERVTTAVPPGPDGDEYVRVRLLAGAICGSDLAKFRGVPDPRWPHDGEIGFPLHEIVGELVAPGTQDDGVRVVGMASQFRGLAEEFFADPSLLVLVPEELCDVHATMIQPLATVLCSVGRMPDPSGKRVAIVGLGSIGALFAHVLRQRGAGEVWAVDPVDRTDLRSSFGLDGTVQLTSRAWAAQEGVADSFDLIVEAVGHQAQTFADAVRLAAVGGHVVGFGVPDESHYAVPITEMFRKQLTVQLGETTNWRQHLQNATSYLLEHTESLAGYLTDAFPLADAGLAYTAAATPRPGQLKVGIYGPPSLRDRRCLMPAVGVRFHEPAPR